MNRSLILRQKPRGEKSQSPKNLSRTNLENKYPPPAMKIRHRARLHPLARMLDFRFGGAEAEEAVGAAAAGPVTPQRRFLEKQHPKPQWRHRLPRLRLMRRREL